MLEPNQKEIRVAGEELGVEKAKLEKGLYRLKQLGIVSDWTIENFFEGGVFFVDCENFSLDSIKKSLIDNIRRYDADFSLERINQSPNEMQSYHRILNKQNEGYSEFDRYIYLLLQWSYDHMVYSRRQSLKTIYENCNEFALENISRDEFTNRLENYFRVNESSYFLQHIAENPQDYKKWFEPFYQIEEGGGRTTDLISLNEQRKLRDSLGRFLESYRNNVGLNVISGLVRLSLGDYDNTDGRTRLELALQRIQRDFELNQQSIIIDLILETGVSLDNDDKALLAQSIHQCFQDRELLRAVYKRLNDSFSLSVILENFNEKLIDINTQLRSSFFLRE